MKTNNNTAGKIKNNVAVYMYVYVYGQHMTLSCRRVWINRVRLSTLHVVSWWTGKINIISLSPFVPEKLVSRDGFGRPVPRMYTLEYYCIQLLYPLCTQGNTMLAHTRYTSTKYSTSPGEERCNETGKAAIAHGSVEFCEATPIGLADES